MENGQDIENELLGGFPSTTISDELLKGDHLLDSFLLPEEIPNFMPAETFFGDYLDKLLLSNELQPTTNLPLSNEAAAPPQKSGPPSPRFTEDDSDNDNNDSAGSGGKNDGERKSRLKTDRAVALNRQAQLRYREKKKMHVKELEDRVTASETVNSQLRAELALTKLALAQARKAQNILSGNKRKQPGGGAPPVADGTFNGAIEAAVPGLKTEDVDEDSHDWIDPHPDRCLLLQPLEMEFGRAIDALKEILARAGDNPSKKDAELCAELNKTFAACLRSRQVAGPCYNRLMASADKWKALDSGLWLNNCGHWRKVALAAQVSPEQKLQIAVLRDEMVESLVNIYTKRHLLQNQITALVLAGANETAQPCLIATGGHDDDGDATSPKDSDQGGGYFFGDPNRLNQEHMKTVYALKKNLNAEQETWRKVHDALMSDGVRDTNAILDVVQTSKVLVASYPEHCDTIALVHALVEGDEMVCCSAEKRQKPSA
jgi:hypothetical protein